VTTRGGDLRIAYNSEILRDVCHSWSIAIKYLGEEAASFLWDRHADIQASSNVFELPVGQISVDGNLCTLQVQNLLFIVLSPNHALIDNEGLYDWSTVGRVKIMRINDVR
jgi:hypothetical protein